MTPDKHDAADSQNESDLQAILHLQESLARGKHWYLSLLESIRLWKSPEEIYKGRQYQYLIDGEAFDWLLLAERLCLEVEDSIPEKEKIDLLFFDRPPIELSTEQFKKLIGVAKYRAYLNYLYGVLVEESLLSAVKDEIRKEHRVAGWSRNDNITDKAYKRIYGETFQLLFHDFKKEKKHTRRRNLSLGIMKEFSYWLFKYRVKHCDNSRVASDTKKALLYMNQKITEKKQLTP